MSRVNSKSHVGQGRCKIRHSSCAVFKPQTKPGPLLYFRLICGLPHLTSSAWAQPFRVGDLAPLQSLFLARGKEVAAAVEQLLGLLTSNPRSCSCIHSVGGAVRWAESGMG